MKRYCPIPDCGKEITYRNRAGVCKDHTHAVGYCQCNACTRKSIGRALSEKRAQLSQTMRSRVDPIRAKFIQAREKASRAPVTLMRAPWEDKE